MNKTKTLVDSVLSSEKPLVIVVTKNVCELRQIRQAVLDALPGAKLRLSANEVINRRGDKCVRFMVQSNDLDARLRGIPDFELMKS
jgi:hypothetical protein